ncbi:MAG: BrnT family toxin [Gammaproteobacteria bacterium]
MHTLRGMEISWDPGKAKANLRKHRVRFPDAESVLFDPAGVTVEDPDSQDEQRFITIGLDALGRVLVVVYAYHQEQIRLISARRASRSEIQAYEKGV